MKSLQHRKCLHLIINGVDNSNFAPDKDITRAEFSAILVKGLGLMRPGTGKDTFTDVTKDAWYYDAVSISYEYGLISGYEDGTFKPTDKVTREQAMTMIARAMQITGLDSEMAAKDADHVLSIYVDSSQLGGWAKNSVVKCISTQLVAGRNGNQIAPKYSITRAEVAVIMRRLLQKSGLIVK